MITTDRRQYWMVWLALAAVVLLVVLVVFLPKPGYQPGIVPQAIPAANFAVGLFSRFQARRASVLPLWAQGKRPDEIARLTGYEIDTVKTVIKNHRNAVEDHKGEFDELMYDPERDG